MDPWSPCSATCGGGSQTRTVRCMRGPEGRSREVESQLCLDTGRRPSDSRLCNLLPCARWATTSWGPVSSPIVEQIHVSTSVHRLYPCCLFVQNTVTIRLRGRAPIEVVSRPSNYHLAPGAFGSFVFPNDRRGKHTEFFLFC